jgi:unsaturated rhamnogalacturonyl hydrolase
MGPLVWVRMYAATGDKKYISYLDEEWWKTSDLLYDIKEHLYARDASYSTKTEANGQKMFWGRGNGWVMGGIVRTLEYLPKDDLARRKSPAAHSCRLRLKRVQAYLRRGAPSYWREAKFDKWW